MERGQNGIKFFRMSSETFPWASEYYQDWDSVPNIRLYSKMWYRERWSKSKRVWTQITSHPGPFQCIGITERKCSSEHNHRFDYPRRHYLTLWDYQEHHTTN